MCRAEAESVASAERRAARMSDRGLGRMGSLLITPPGVPRALLLPITPSGTPPALRLTQHTARGCSLERFAGPERPPIRTSFYALCSDALTSEPAWQFAMSHLLTVGSFATYVGPGV